MRIHIISIGGSIMHQLAISLKNAGHIVTGSDDEIYDPSKSELEKYELLPAVFGWYEHNIHEELDFVILGMHAKKGNPEIEKAISLGLKVYSYPEFIYEYSKNKKRVVIGGSHGKTTTTSMVMHILKHAGYQFDYLIGARVPGFNSSVHISDDNQIIVIEGDEYLSSALDNRSKFIHYQADIAVLTGISWDHINVFPTLDSYYNTFSDFIKQLKDDSLLIYHDSKPLKTIVNHSAQCKLIRYNHFTYNQDGYFLNDKIYEVNFFGKHNFSNMKAAYEVCKTLGISDQHFISAMKSFETPDKRLNVLYDSKNNLIIRDFAHAPSKVRATVQAVKEKYTDKNIHLILELHTYSSLNKSFLSEYNGVFNGLRDVTICYNPKTLEIKNMAPISEKTIQQKFDNQYIQLKTSREEISDWLKMSIEKENVILLIMSSGHLGGVSLEDFVNNLSQ